MIDSLDTMFLMGLHDEFERGLAIVKQLEFRKHEVCDFLIVLKIVTIDVRVISTECHSSKQRFVTLGACYRHTHYRMTLPSSRRQMIWARRSSLLSIRLPGFPCFL